MENQDPYQKMLSEPEEKVFVDNSNNTKIDEVEKVDIPDSNNLNPKVPLLEDKSEKDYNLKLLNKNSNLYICPGNNYEAKLHSDSFKLNDGNQINPYSGNKFYSKIRKSTLFKHGIDLSNLFIIIKYLITLITACFIMKWIVVFFVVVVFDRDFTEIKIYKNIDFFLAANNLEYGEALGYNVTFYIMTVICFILLSKKIDHMTKKYNKRVSNLYYCDESIYSIFVKNLPMDTSTLELEDFLRKQFNVGIIRNIYLLKDIRQIYSIHQSYMSLLLERNNYIAKSKIKQEKLYEYNSNLTKIKNKLIRKIKIAYDVDHINNKFINKENEKDKEENKQIKINPIDSDKQIENKDNKENDNNQINSNYDNESEKNFFSSKNSFLNIEIQKTKQIDFSRTAIVVFERNEDKNQFLRPLISIKQFFNYLYYKPIIFRGKRLFIENVPQINLINFPNTKYSTEKLFFKGNIQFIFYFLLGLFVNYIFTAIKVAFLFGASINVPIPLFSTIILYSLNYLMNIIIRLTVKSFKFSDIYLENIFIQFACSQRNFIITFLIQMTYFISYLTTEMNHREGSNKKYFKSVEFFLVTLFRSLLFLRYNKEFILRRIKFVIRKYVFCSKLTQNELNELLAENRLNAIETYFIFKDLIIAGILLLSVSFFCSLAYFVAAFAGYFIIVNALNNSEFNTYDDEGINMNIKNRYHNLINHYGFFFSKFLYFEIISISFIFIVCTMSYVLSYYVVIFAYVFFNDIYFSYQFISLWNSNLHTSKTYSELKPYFQRSFKNSKWVDFQRLINDLVHDKDLKTKSDE